MSGRGLANYVDPSPHAPSHEVAGATATLPPTVVVRRCAGSSGFIWIHEVIREETPP
jgi:hypothetical protein